jgi:hypothetical protein
MGLALSILTACQEHPRPDSSAAQLAADVKVPGLAGPETRSDLDATVAPPEGWQPQAVRENSRHVHQIWISPSGNTAYGVILMNLPWPVGPDWTLWGFLKHMKESEGEATVLSKQADPQLPGYRFVADGKKYEIRVNLIVQGSRAWAIYAGTVRNKPVVQNELELAQKARDHTRVGLANGSGAQVAAGG